MGNINPTPEQFKKAKEDFLFRAQPLFDRLNLIYSYTKPVAIYDFEKREVKVSLQLNESFENERQYLEGKIKDLKEEIESNILSY